MLPLRESAALTFVDEDWQKILHFPANVGFFVSLTPQTRKIGNHPL
jgi:hypothetical protein